MPKLVLFRDVNGGTPVLEWMDGLPQKARELCQVRIEHLRDLGHTLRRPEADYLKAGIYELRAKSNGVQYRILYFFDGQAVVVVSHGIIKQQATVPARAIARALECRQAYLANPIRHTHGENWP